MLFFKQFPIVVFIAVQFCATLVYAQAKRVALVMGVTNYDHTRALPNAATDARAIKDALEGIGFAVSLVQDVNYEEMRRAIRAFGIEASQSEMALVYFSGHGLENNRDNWLLPRDAKLEKQADIEYEAIVIAHPSASV